MERVKNGKTIALIAIFLFGAADAPLPTKLPEMRSLRVHKALFYISALTHTHMPKVPGRASLSRDGPDQVVHSLLTDRPSLKWFLVANMVSPTVGFGLSQFSSA